MEISLENLYVDIGTERVKHPIMFGLFAKLTKIPLSHPETSLTSMCISCL